MVPPPAPGPELLETQQLNSVSLHPVLSELGQNKRELTPEGLLPITIQSVTDDPNLPDIWSASQTGDLVRVQTILRFHPEAAYRPGPKDHVPPLHWAALNNQLDIIKCLLDAGAPVNALGGEQWSTALHWAATKGHLEAMGLLLNYGADPTIRDQPGYTTLHLAAQHGQIFAILYLLSIGRNEVDERDNFGRTALLWAAYRGHTEAVQVLLQENASPDAIDNGGTTILHWGVIRGHFHIVRLLLRYRADPTVKDASGKIAADWAREKGHYEWYASLLIEFDRKSLIIKDFGWRTANYWRQSRRVAKIMLGKVIPALFLPLMWAILYWTWPWMLGMFLVMSVMGIFDRYLRPILFPSVLPMETSLVFTYQLVIIFTSMFIAARYLHGASASDHPLLYWIYWGSTLASLWFLRKVKLADPGIIRPSLDVEKRRRLILDLVADGELNRRKYCITCRVRKPLRSKHCRACDVCVAKFDHHCPWTGTCVGIGNHRDFFLYVIAVVAGLVYFIALSILCKNYSLVLVLGSNRVL